MVKKHQNGTKKHQKHKNGPEIVEIVKIVKIDKIVEIVKIVLVVFRPKWVKIVKIVAIAIRRKVSRALLDGFLRAAMIVESASSAMNRTSFCSDMSSLP